MQHRVLEILKKKKKNTGIHLENLCVACFHFNAAFILGTSLF